MTPVEFGKKALELACHYQNRCCDQAEIIELFCMDAAIEPERIRAAERERCAAIAEQMTARSRKIRAALNGVVAPDCPVAAAIRNL